MKIKSILPAIFLSSFLALLSPSTMAFTLQSFFQGGTVEPFFHIEIYLHKGWSIQHLTAEWLGLDSRVPFHLKDVSWHDFKTVTVHIGDSFPKGDLRFKWDDAHGHHDLAYNPSKLVTLQYGEGARFTSEIDDTGLTGYVEERLPEGPNAFVYGPKTLIFTESMPSQTKEIGECEAGLSGGQKQRLAIARAIEAPQSARFR